MLNQNTIMEKILLDILHCLLVHFAITRLTFPVSLAHSLLLRLIGGFPCNTTLPSTGNLLYRLFAHKQPREIAINTVWKEGDKYTGVVHAANILEGVTDTAHSTILWSE